MGLLSKKTSQIFCGSLLALLDSLSTNSVSLSKLTFFCKYFN